MHTLTIATSTHIGGREEQQDSMGEWSTNNNHLIIIADGVGGNVGGAAASKAVIQCADAFWEQSGGVFTSPKENLTTIAENAHEAIRQIHPGERRSPASTIVALYITPDQAHWIHCGDSRLYWLRNGKELTRTRDHSVVQLLVEQGKITPDEVNSHPDKGRILKTLGGSSFKGLDYDSCEYEAGDTFALCSDGYWESLSPGDEILPPDTATTALDAYAEKILQQAVLNNGADSDNTSLAIVHAQPDTPAAPPNQKKSGIKAVLLTLLYTIIFLDIILLIYFLILK